MRGVSGRSTGQQDRFNAKDEKCSKLEHFVSSEGFLKKGS